MNSRISQPAVAPAADSADELASIRVDRAQTELKHGRAIILVDADPAAPSLLVAAVETLIVPRWQWFAATASAHGGTPSLLVTAERAQAMGLMAVESTLSAVPDSAAAPAAVLLGLAAAADVTVETLQSLAAVHPGPLPNTRIAGALADALGAPVGDLHPALSAGSTMQAALALAKRARLTPALLVAELPMAAPASAQAQLQAAQLMHVNVDDIAQVQRDGPKRLRRVSDAHVPITAHPDCTLVLFRELHGDAEHVAVIVGQPDLSQPVPVRVHSACLTGDLLGSLRCDCGDQLHLSIARLAQHGGVLLYLAQEGRGTGLANKLRAYRLQDAGLDTIDADRHLGFRGDERDFHVAVEMLQSLGITRIQLLTNNPHKIDALRRGGIEVVARLAVPAPVNPHNARYIQTKRERAGHLPAEPEAL